MAEIIEATANENHLIDATQEAVIKAVDNVSEMIVETTEMSEFHNHGHEVFYKSAEFWVGFAFILVVIALVKPVSKALKAMISNRRDDIVNQINQAEKLHDDAQLLLAQYERKFLHAKDEANEILQKSQNNIECFKNTELQKLENELNLRRKEVDAGIEASVEKARSEINNVAGTMAIDIAKNYLRKNFTSEDKSAEIDRSIEQILSLSNKI